MHSWPSQHWPARTEVTLDADLHGVDFGNGVWGETDRTGSSSIGERHVSTADADTHRMEVHDGDRLVQNFPMSAGSPDTPSCNGPHVVTEVNHHRVVDSGTYGVPARGRWPGRGGRTSPTAAAPSPPTGPAGSPSSPGPGRRGIRGSDAGTLRSDTHDWTLPWEEWTAGSALA